LPLRDTATRLPMSAASPVQSKRILQHLPASPAGTGQPSRYILPILAGALGLLVILLVIGATAVLGRLKNARSIPTGIAAVAATKSAQPQTETPYPANTPTLSTTATPAASSTPIPPTPTDMLQPTLTPVPTATHTPRPLTLTPTPSRTPVSVATKDLLKDGDVVALKCLGHIEGPRWLDGRTGNGTVGLAPQLGGAYTGTKWQVFKVGDNIFNLKCLGDREGPRWLDGRTGNGIVGLAPELGGMYTGTRWQAFEAGNNIIILKCLGDKEGPRWLDGRTGNGTVGLAPQTSGYPGTSWEIVK
jgi:hypothetical protein